ncbi:membrane-bound acylglycerophosphatidylinositol O-acyltransferase mboat7-like [Tubulanus polymorphus]|uniref:membrane-bound acylglycerophosphatidylinositol O-acyltransferase mboat7-like n=1 Tax=Tubulanus polymorphus TaxID=672921 RepID=UPI003DA2E96C
MTSDDLIYAILLAISILFGLLLKRLKHPRLKQAVAGCLGLCFVLYICGWHTLHSVITIAGNILIIKFISTRKCHIASFIWCFGYLVFFRTTHYLGLPKVPSHCNAVQLLMTLKLVGLAFEIHDSFKIRKEFHDKPDDVQAQLRLEYESISPSVWDTIMYCYCYVGIFTGPYYKYRTYQDAMWLKSSKKIPMLMFLMERLKTLPFYAMAFVLVSHYFPTDYAFTDEFYTKHSAWYHLWYTVLLFFQLRMRIYTAWQLSECICIVAGIGCYPTLSKPKNGGGPTNLQVLKDSEKLPSNQIVYDFETIRNIDPYSCEFRPTLRGAMKAWNMSVQWWLANYVYKRIPIKSLRVTLTMAVSAFWHGVHPGYYLSFLSVPPYLMVESALIKVFREPASERGQKIFDFISCIFRMRVFEYLSVGFLLLTLEDTLNYWSSLRFFMHIYMVVCGIFVFAIKFFFVKERKPKET